MSIIDTLKKEFQRAEIARAGRIGAAEDVREVGDLNENVPLSKIEVPSEVVNLQLKKQELRGEAAALARFADFFVSTEGGQTYVYREVVDPELGEPVLHRQTVKSFHELYAGETVIMPTGAQPISRVWFASAQRTTYPQGLALLPEQTAPKGVYNLWRGFGFQPDAGATALSVRGALWHLKYIICSGDQSAYRYLLGWLGHAVQNPEKQAEVAVVMIGGRGTGKGVVGGWFRSMFGAHGTHIQSADHLTGKFNGHLKCSVALFVDEAFFVGDRQGNNKLKSLITEDRSMLEGKYMAASPSKNRLKIMMATNDEHAVVAGSDERRFFVTRVSDRMKQNHLYFGALTDWWAQGGGSAFLGFLQRLDLRDFNTRQVPQTSALADQKLQSLTGLDAWLYECLQQHEDAWERMREQPTTSLAAQFKYYCDNQGGRYKYENTSPISVSRGIRRWIDVERRRETSKNRNWLLILPPLHTARDQFADKLKILIDWDC